MRKDAERLYRLEIQGHICPNRGEVCESCVYAWSGDGCDPDCNCYCHCKCIIPSEYDIFAAGFESPIEEMFGAELWKKRSHSLSVASQVWVYRMCRADFCILLRPYGCREPSYIDLPVDEAPRYISVAVFCDGHEFHERTPEQAERDRKIDRELQLLGIGVARFTGREIHRSPEACVVEALKIHKLLEDKRAGSYTSVMIRQLADSKNLIW